MGDTLQQIGVGGAFAIMVLALVLNFLTRERDRKRVVLPCAAGSADYWRQLGEMLMKEVCEPLHDAIERMADSQLRLSENQQRTAEVLAGIVARLPK